MSESNGQLVIECGPPDAAGVCAVSARHGKRQHRDRFNPGDAFKRSKFCQRVIQIFELDESVQEFLDAKIQEAADNAETEPLVQCSTVRLSEVTPQQIEWLWPDRFAIGKLALVVGDPGLGKSFLTLDIAARISRGAPWPDNPWEPQPAGDVILLSAEDDLHDMIRPRLDALGADPSRIIAIKGAKFIDECNDRTVNLATDLASIRKVIQSANQARAIVIDPVSAYMGSTDSHKNAEVRSLLAPLAELAAELRVAVIAVSHLRKGEGAAMYRTMGSLAFIAAARSAWVVARDEVDKTRRLLLPLKSNIAPDIGGLAYAILPHGPAGAHVLCWELEPVSVLADDAIGNRQRKRGPAADDRDEAGGWLRAELAAGPRPAKELISDGDGIGFTKRTLQRALRDIGGKSEKRGFSSGWLWSLGDGDTKAHERTRHPQPGTLGQTCHLRQNPIDEEVNNKFLRNGSAKATGSESVEPSDDDTPT